MGLLKKTDELFQTLGAASPHAAEARGPIARPAARPAGPIPGTGPVAVGSPPPPPPRPVPLAGGPPAVRVAGSAPAGPPRPSFASLLPAGAQRAPDPAAPRVAPALALHGDLRSSAIEPRPDDGAPILVIEDFPAGASIIPEAAKPHLARTVTLRVDTAAVGGFVGAIAIAVAFMLGRSSVRLPALQPGGGPQETAAATHAASEPTPLNIIVPLEDAAPPSHSPAPLPQPAAEQASAPQPAPAPAQQEGLFWITVLQKGTKEGTEEVKKLLESKGLVVKLDKVGERFNVHVGAYPDPRSPALARDLAIVRAIEYRGKKAFHDAIPEAMKRSQ